MKEHKQLILDLLLTALQQTSNLWDLEDLKYKRYGDCEEAVIATFSNGGEKRVNVSMDSGTAMIIDVIRGIV